jgi:hypothetical protein
MKPSIDHWKKEVVIDVIKPVRLRIPVTVSYVAKDGSWNIDDLKGKCISYFKNDDFKGKICPVDEFFKNNPEYVEVG